MAVYTGVDGAIEVNGVSVAEVRSISLEMSSDTIETSVMGDSSRTYLKGMSSFSGTADIYFVDSEWAGSDVTFNPTSASGSVGDAPVTLKFWIYDDPSATTDVGFTGNIIITGHTINASMDGMTEASISFQGSGGATFSNTGTL